MADYLFGRNAYNPGGSRSVRNKIYGSLYALGGSGTVIPYSIMVYSEQGSSNIWRCAIYDAYYNLIAITEDRLIGWGHWYEFVLNSPPALIKGQSYYLVAWSNTREGGGYVSGYGYKVGAGVSQDFYYGAYPGTLMPSTHDRLVSIYCTYDTTPPCPIPTIEKIIKE